jgi:hypothetical protein
MTHPSDERYTPDYLTQHILSVLGTVDLDPTAERAKSFPATHHLTRYNNCLTTDWTPLILANGTVYMNSPFSDSRPFLERLAHYQRLGKIRSAITVTLAGALSNQSTQPLFAESSTAVCLPRGRINFTNLESLSKAPSNMHDVAIALWGYRPDLDLFVEVFSRVGLIMYVAQ